MIGAFISGCAGVALTPAETGFFQKANPWGLILFKRNCESPAQVKELTAAFRAATGRRNAPVFIDQEGGRVQRMGPPVPQWRKYPPAAAYGRYYEKFAVHALRAARLVGRLMAHDLFSVGITANCIPCLDLPQPGSAAVISDRAYSTKPEAALALARAHTIGFVDGGIMPVMKHIPGHGRAEVDSHHELPVIKASRRELEIHDYYPFAGFADCPMAMTAHVVYQAIDPDHPATQSKTVIRDVIRKQMAYNGLIMTDDISMQALSGSITERTKKSLAAGCDLILHCNGIMEEMEEVAAAAGELKGKSLARAKAALKTQRKPQKFEEKLALRDLDEIMRNLV